MTGTTLSRIGKLSQDGRKVSVKKPEWDQIVEGDKKKNHKITELTKEKKVLEKNTKDKDALITYLQTKVTNLEKKRKGKAGSRKHEVNTDVIAAIDTCVKGILFQTVKFAQASWL